MPNEASVVEPLGAMVSKAEPVDEAMTNGLVAPALPTTVRVFCGVVVLIPTLLKRSTWKIDVPVEEDIFKGLTPALPWTLKV